jgi:pimeloyl-ACP methyl ester carboxylesterase
LIDLPDGPATAGLVVLHGAAAGNRDHRLYAHLAQVLPPAGIAVLRYDRRTMPDDRDVPLRVQADDAHAALRRLRDRVGDVPLGLWGWSQGAWAALVAAANGPVDFLVLVSACGISPARQMRYGTAEQLRRNGFGADDIADLLRLRRTVDDYLRGAESRERAQAAVDAAATKPWFPLGYVPRTLPEPGSWADMDWDPAAVIARVDVPTLLFFGETDEWMPIDVSIAAWRGKTVTIRRLAGSGHEPALSPLYTDALLAWLRQQSGDRAQ